MGNGYVVEYVTLTLPAPNAGTPPLTTEEKVIHEKAAGGLTAVFKLANRPVHARDLITANQYDELQDRWDKRGDRVRWSEAFPVIEAWDITGWPKARDVLGSAGAARLCEIQSQVLRPPTDEDRRKIAALEITPISLPSEGFAARYFYDLARQEDEERGLSDGAVTSEDKLLYEDYRAIEGVTKELRLRLAKRDRRLVRLLKQNAPLKCSICSYDPTSRGASRKQAQAILEAHHRIPIHAGQRLSRVGDLVLLCPTCHREVHQRIASIPPS
jgi:5-methylcytosine-specific restriction enzyme A